MDLKSLGSNEKCVWVVDGDKLLPTVVTIGDSNGLKTQILSGINEGTTVATGFSESAGPNGGGQSAQKSPFAPTPPGRKKK